MKKRLFAKIITTAFIGICMLATGCSEAEKELINHVIEEGLSVAIEESGQGQSDVQKQNDQGNQAPKTVDSTEVREIRELEETAGALVKNLGGYFAYQYLSEDRQGLYNSLYDILAAGATEITVPTLDTNEIDYVFNCVMLDHPELFYVEGYSYTKYTVNGELNSIDFSGTYNMEPEEVADKQAQIDHAVEDIYSKFPIILSQYDIVKYFYETIILNTDYRLGALNNQNICSVFLTHESVCQGYAKTLQYLLQLEGIEAVLVTGQVTGGEGHAWLIANLDGYYYHIDPTWGDASYTANETNEVQKLPDINYDYLCVTTDEIGKNHIIDELIEYPYCFSLDDNFYVREGLFFESVDENKLHHEFDQAYASGQMFLTFKCQNEKVYSEMVDYLLSSENAHVFEYLQSGMTQVIYSLNDEQGSITIWLS